VLFERLWGRRKARGTAQRRRSERVRRCGGSTGQDVRAAAAIAPSDVRRTTRALYRAL
jgi:hypothetical protein